MSVARRAPCLGLLALLSLFAAAARAQEAPPSAPAPAEEPAPYGGTPREFEPHRGAGEPARRFFLEPPTYRGPGAEEPDAPVETSVRLGVVVPLSGLDAPVGRRMRQGYELAVEEANARGGYREGLPFELRTMDEHDTWGAAGNALVELVTHQGCLAVLGALDDQNSHVMTRVLLKLAVPMVNTGGTDPTLTEHMIPWLVRLRPDDRQASYRLARKVFQEDGHRRVAFFRGNDRYARQGVAELADAARRLNAPIVLEVRFDAGDEEFGRQVARLKAAAPDAIVLWGRPAPTGRALAALRAAGVTVPVYGPDRLYDVDFLAAAGPAAEGLVVAMPFDPTQTTSAWTAFAARYAERFGEAPDHHAAHAYDGANFLLEAVRRAGPNPARIRAALYAPRRLEGVGGTIRFDATQNNVTPMILGKVVHGAYRFD